ncbi:DUF3817 domain-containing protein [Raineyella sp. LH-20]|uniref:DUF3817 domain-containing protein n=1 Tax=Raineyella sp. LH-20 TaxID=3081204 RepID=UPI002953CEBF|nr:DUF3817 domain-containing protein [Raineyella sp. LH-20]WOP19589.1 DUF3817 domain-containing protein [Raineyella sp. LH-20]
MDPQKRSAIQAALVRYRVMAWVVGCLLVVLVCVGVPLEYVWHYDKVDMYLGVAHGWLYMVLLITAYDIGRRVKWPWINLLGIALAGTVPFLSFVAEHYATRNVRRYLAEADATAVTAEASAA